MLQQRLKDDNSLPRSKSFGRKVGQEGILKSELKDMFGGHLDIVLCELFGDLLLRILFCGLAYSSLRDLSGDLCRSR